MADRQELIARALVGAADTLVHDFDVVDFLSGLATSCVELFAGVDAGVMVADPTGEVRVVASSSEQLHLLELFVVQQDQGPCIDCARTGRAVECPDLREAGGQWPIFAPAAVDAGFTSVHALPMRLRRDVVGALHLLRRVPGRLDPGDLVVAQALADVATIGILQHRVAEEARLLNEQLEGALDSRVTIEQAKGILAGHSGQDPDTAFDALRQYARSRNERLVAVARAVVHRTLPASAILPAGP